MVYVIQSVMIALLLFIASSSGPGEDVGKRVPKPAEQLVQVRQYGRCTGSVIAHNEVLTAAHCISDPDAPLVVRFSDGEERLFHVMSAGYRGTTPIDGGTYKDWAILVGDTGDVEPWDLSDEIPQAGESLFYRAWNDDGQTQVSGRAYGRSWNQWDGGDPVLHFESEVWPGDSGSPLFCRSGKICGVVIAHYRGTPVSIASLVHFFNL